MLSFVISAGCGISSFLQALSVSGCCPLVFYFLLLCSVYIFFSPALVYPLWFSNMYPSVALSFPPLHLIVKWFFCVTKGQSGFEVVHCNNKIHCREAECAGVQGTGYCCCKAPLVPPQGAGVCPSLTVQLSLSRFQYSQSFLSSFLAFCLVEELDISLWNDRIGSE